MQPPRLLLGRVLYIILNSIGPLLLFPVFTLKGPCRSKSRLFGCALLYGVHLNIIAKMLSIRLES